LNIPKRIEFVKNSTVIVCVHIETGLIIIVTAPTIKNDIIRYHIRLLITKTDGFCPDGICVTDSNSDKTAWLTRKIGGDLMCFAMIFAHCHASAYDYRDDICSESRTKSDQCNVLLDTYAIANFISKSFTRTFKTSIATYMLRSMQLILWIQ